MRMTSVLGLVFLIIIAISGKYAVDKIRIKTIGFNFLIHSGFYYLILGFLSNPNILNILELSVLKKAEFFFNFILGWTGFLVGLQLNFKGMKRFPKKYFLLSITHFALSFVLIFIFLLCLQKCIGLMLGNVYLMLLAITGSMGSVLGIGLLVKERKVRSVNAHFLQFTTAFDNVLGVLFLGILFFVHQLDIREVPQAFLVYAFSFFVILLLALLYKYLDAEFSTVEEETLLILGLILIVVGMARYLHNSILFLSFFLGVLVINMKIDTKKILITVQEWEKPLNYILLFAIGLYMDFRVGSLIWVFVGYLLVMLIAKYLSGYFYQRFQLHKRTINNESKLILYGMSSLSLAMVLDAYFTNHNPVLLNLLTVIVLSFYMTNALSLYAAKEKR